MINAPIRAARDLAKAIIIALLLSLLIPAWVFASDSWSLYQHDARHSGQSDFKGPGSASILWLVAFGATGKPTTPIAVSADSKLFVGVEVSPPKESTTTTTTEKKDATGHSGVFAFSKNKNVLWVSKASGRVSGPLAVGKGVVYAVVNTDLVALNEKDGSIKWTVPLGNESLCGVMLDKDGNVYTATLEGRTLYAVTAGGSVKWKYTADGQIDSPPAVGDDGTVYFTAKDLSLYAVTREGSLKWKFKVTEPGTDQLTAPAIGEDGTVYFGGSRDAGYLTKEDAVKVQREYLYAVGSDGKLKWRYQTKGKMLTMPAIARDGTIIFSTTSLNYTEERDFILGNCYVQAINPDGTEKWVFDTVDNAITIPPIIGSDGRVYVSSTEGAMTCISKQGIMIWRAKVGGRASIGPKGIFYITGPTSIAAVADKELTRSLNKEKSAASTKGSGTSPANYLSNLVYILPVAIALGIGYLFKIRLGTQKEDTK
ncbi:MAG: PQQ-binding-like beta-propeller repeat protein [Firmicutes bacterium]|nr:PQQ-binding-like beta-propeller repeat protein [Bacillota bacterium]